MPNIVYVLTNPAMPGIVKIGMTDKLEVQPRMRDLYTTGVPLPFDCVIATEVVSPVISPVPTYPMLWAHDAKRERGPPAVQR